MVLGDVGKATGDQPLDELAHLADMLGRTRLDGRPQAAKRIDVGMKLPAGLFGDLANGLVQRQAGKSRAARSLILSSTSVMLRTYLTCASP